MMTRIQFKSLFVAATVFACLPLFALAQQTSSTDVFKATSPSIGDLDPSLVESELIEGVTQAPVAQPVKTAANTQSRQDTFRPTTSVQNSFGQNNFNQGGYIQTNPQIETTQQPIGISGGNSNFTEGRFYEPQSTAPAFDSSVPPAPSTFNHGSKSAAQINTSQINSSRISSPQFNSGQAITSLPINNGSMIETRIAPTIQTQIMSPKSINVNQPAEIFIQAQNIGQTNVKVVKLIAKLPEHAKFESSNPLPSNVDGQIYEFTLNNLSARAKQIVRINLVPTAKLPLNIATHIQTESQQQFAVSVQQPVLDVAVSGPKAIQTGQTIKHTVTVKNIGDGPAENIRIKPLLPENLQIAANQKTLVPKLVPGQAAKFILSSYARSAGDSDVVFQVSAAGVESRESRSNIRIVRPELGVQILGPGQNYLGREGVYSIQLENTSELPINSIDVSLQVPAGLMINTISQQAKINKVAGSLKWQFPTIAGNQKQVIQFKAKAIKPGNQTFDVMVTSKEIGSKQMALTTNVQGRADLSVRLFDAGEPVGIGNKSEFTIEVSNQGSTTADNVNVQIQLPSALMAVNQENYSIDPSGNFIQFNSIDIAPGKAKTLKFKVVAVTEGEHVVRGSVSIEGSAQTISSENSIFVFESQNAKVSEALTPDVRR